MESISEVHNDELLAMESIYPDSSDRISPNEITFFFETQHGNVLLTCKLHQDYPEKRMPDFTLSLPRSVSKEFIKFEREFLKIVEREFKAMFFGQEVLYMWVEWLKGYAEEQYGEFTNAIVEAVVAEAFTAEIAVADSDGFVLPDGCPTIHHSLPFTEKKSVFVAHLAQVTSLNQVSLVRQALYSNKYINYNLGTSLELLTI
jgi:RWD domain